MKSSTEPEVGLYKITIINDSKTPLIKATQESLFSLQKDRVVIFSMENFTPQNKEAPHPSLEP